MASLSPLKILRHILFATAPLIESHASSFQEFREGSEKRMLHIFFFFRGKILRQEKVQESSDFLQSFWCFFALYDALLGNKGQKRPFEMICCRKNLNRLQYENMCISNDFMFNNIQLMLEWHESSLSEICILSGGSEWVVIFKVIKLIEKLSQKCTHLKIWISQLIRFAHSR